MKTKKQELDDYYAGPYPPTLTYIGCAELEQFAGSITPISDDIAQLYANGSHNIIPIGHYDGKTLLLLDIFK